MIVYGLGGSWLWIAWGGLAWSAGVALKMLLSWVAHSPLSSCPPWLHGVGLGLISGTAELGVAAVLFHANRPGEAIIPQILAFVVGAGCVEALVLLAAGHLSTVPAEEISRWISGASRSGCVRYMVPIERALALAGHVGARGLVCIAVLGGLLWPAAVALITFSLVDGVVTYGTSKRWDWFDPRVCSRFFWFGVIIGALELALFALASQTIP